MSILADITQAFTAESVRILGASLEGVYLHGSAAMNCFREEKSDIDLLVVLRSPVSNAVKLRFMNMLLPLNMHAPRKGIEMSMVEKRFLKPFVYPTPFELHFSNTHAARFRSDPNEYILHMKGTDRDLAAHFTVLYHRGIALYGTSVRDVMDPVPPQDYLDSILYDIENAETDILTQPLYITLNLCRVLAYRREGLVLSKREGGEWGIKNLSEKYIPLVRAALSDYVSDIPMPHDETLLSAFARDMLQEIL